MSLALAVPASEAQPRIFVVAGEVSGDLAAARLVREIRSACPGARISGAGGARMAEAGVDVVIDTSDWGIIGYLEAYVRVPIFASRLRHVLAEIPRRRPDGIVLVDFPGFNVRIARRVAHEIPTVYYFPPMAYGRKGNRAAKLAALPVRVLLPFAFEVDKYREAGADAVFVGHPAVDLVRRETSRDAVRATIGVPPDARLVALLPGSRPQEVKELLPAMLGAVAALRARDARVRGVIAQAAERLHHLIAAAVERSGADVPIVERRTYDLLGAADAAIVASGTATLEAALLEVPMVVVYRVARISYEIGRRVVTGTHIAMPNILAGRTIVPELLQGDVSAEEIARHLSPLLFDTATPDRMRAALRAAVATLGPPGALRRATAEVLRRCGVEWHDATMG
ncbi:MAG: lipid-A-disaccharide synthase [Armatimonadetes bacterium]|nr:lipid-A-disaccharide synthase [Armatimonadota bacterium]